MKELTVSFNREEIAETLMIGENEANRFLHSRYADEAKELIEESAIEIIDKMVVRMLEQNKDVAQQG